MLYSTAESIHRFIFDSKDFPDISLPVRKIHNVIAISYDVNTQYVYWIDAKTNTIRRAFENGSDDTKVISASHIAPYDLAIDPYGQQLYWTDIIRDDINIFSLRTMKSLGVVMSKKNERPRSIVLYPEKGQMFWTDIGSNGPSILRAAMDGASRQPIVSSGLHSPEGLAVDVVSEKHQVQTPSHKLMNTVIQVIVDLSGTVVHGGEDGLSPTPTPAFKCAPRSL
jgi:low density lipoprotein receptor-related protein 5/6